MSTEVDKLSMVKEEKWQDQKKWQSFDVAAAHDVICFYVTETIYLLLSVVFSHLDLDSDQNCLLRLKLVTLQSAEVNNYSAIIVPH